MARCLIFIVLEIMITDSRRLRMNILSSLNTLLQNVRERCFWIAFLSKCQFDHIASSMTLITGRLILASMRASSSSLGQE